MAQSFKNAGLCCYMLLLLTVRNQELWFCRVSHWRKYRSSLL